MATGLTTKEVAKQLHITGKELRRILRSFDRYDDGKYTRYLLGKRDVEQVAKRLADRKPEPKPKAKKSRKTTKPVIPPVVETGSTTQPQE